MSSPAEKPSVRAVTTQIKLKNLRAAAVELKRLDPYRKQFHNFDRLVASVHSPLNNAEKLLYEAHALIPGLVQSDVDGGDPTTRVNRTRAAISKLIKARQIVKDDPEINTLLKRCLAALEVAETKVSVAQSHVVRGHWDAAYQNIQEAAQFDDSPDVQETRKYITGVYKVHLKDNAQFQAFIKVSKITGAFLGVAIVAAVIYGLVQNYESAQELRRVGAPASVAQARPATAPAPVPAIDPGLLVTPAPETPASTPAASSPVAGSGDSSTRGTTGPAVAQAALPQNQKPVDKKVTLNATEEFGTSLGPLPAGTKITLRYESGTWCAWLRGDGFSPDRPSEGGNINRVAIAGINNGVLKVLTLVGYRTQEQPFSYTLPAAYDRVLLRINDETGSFETNDGSVVYDVSITPPTAAKP